MVALVGNEYVKKCVAVVVADRESHPVADYVDAHFLSHGRELHTGFRGVVLEHLQYVTVVRNPQVWVFVVVVVEEHDPVGTSSRVAYAIAVLVFD